MSTNINEYFNQLSKWQPELQRLRQILNDTMLTETYKWKHPCYTYQKSNIVIIGAFKEYCTLNFFKGVLLKDPEKILKQPGKNSQTSRTIHFTSVTQIQQLEATIKAYIFEAIEVEKTGLKIKLKQVKDYDIPKELALKFKENIEFKDAFYTLTPGRQKGYLLYFSGAKQAKTRTTRIEKYSSKILDGKGLNDCTCGFSKKMPNCDGSHKYIK